MKATGNFEVNLQPLVAYTKGKDGINIGRNSIDKTFDGELVATSKGEMLTAITPVEGSAGYVALEQVTGTLSGKRGSFTMQHFGIMQQGEQVLLLEVIPGSGTGDLAGISGKMSIRNESGKHYYEFDFELPGKDDKSQSNPA